MEEWIDSPDGRYLQRWQCEVPEPYLPYQVLEDKWNEDYTIRVVKRIRLV